MLDQIVHLREDRDKELVPITCFLEMMTWQVDVLRQLYDDRFIFEEVKTFHFNIRILKVILK